MINTLVPYGTPLAKNTGKWAADIYDGQRTRVGGYFMGASSKRGVVSVITMLILTWTTPFQKILHELRQLRFPAVMATTGLLYLAILTAFGTDLVARAQVVYCEGYLWDLPDAKAALLAGMEAVDRVVTVYDDKGISRWALQVGFRYKF